MAPSKTEHSSKHTIANIDNSTPAVVLKSVAHGGLGIVRSLGRLGIPAYTIEASPWTPAIYSRYNRGVVKLDVETAPAAQALDQLHEFAERLGTKSVLIPSTDYAAIFIADHAEKLRRWFLFPEQSSDLLSKLYSKWEMYLLAKRIGVPTVETLLPRTREDVLHFAQTMRFPVVLKAIDGTRLSRYCGKKMFIVHRIDELLHLYDSLEDPVSPNLILQEYIDGEDDSVWMFNGYFNQRSECIAAFTGKKLRQCPAFSGYTCLGVCLANPVVQETATQFLRALNYNGLVDIDFRYDQRDGQYKILDVNPRIGATFQLFTAQNGMDLVRLYYLDVTGQRVPPAAIKEGRKWIVGDLDVASSLRYLRAGRLTLSQWLGSLQRIEDTAYFAADDPLPVLLRVADDACEFVRRACNGLLRIRPQSHPHVVATASGTLAGDSEPEAA
ncbi:MAG TPA: ATP-grasp domain-containing protein [Terriglobales bacterium]|nr:ATP-grasp domain-containing protein [Terriglobales bacterium]